MGHAIDGEHGPKAMAIRQWIGDRDKLRYEMIFTPLDTVPADEPQPVRRFMEETET